MSSRLFVSLQQNIIVVNRQTYPRSKIVITYFVTRQGALDLELDLLESYNMQLQVIIALSLVHTLYNSLWHTLSLQSLLGNGFQCRRYFCFIVSCPRGLTTLSHLPWFQKCLHLLSCRQVGRSVKVLLASSAQSFLVSVSSRQLLHGRKRERLSNDTQCCVLNVIAVK